MQTPATEQAKAPGQDWRCERKFVARGAAVCQVEGWVRKNPARFFQKYPPRFVNNLYFDTPFFRYLKMSVDGAGHRQKVRIRWYGSLLEDPERRVLEVKKKRGLAGAKTSFVIAKDTQPAARKKSGWDRLAGLSAREAGEPCLRPVLVNRYFRRYFESADGLFRLTLDSDMEYWSMGTAARRPNTHRPQPGRIIMEVKYPVHMDTRAQEITRHFPIRLDKHSKYVTGMRLTGCGLFSA